MKTAKAKLAAVPTKRHVVGLLSFCRQTGIPLWTVVSAIERRRFTEEQGFIVRKNGFYGVDLDVFNRRYGIKKATAR